MMTIEQQALALVNEVRAERKMPPRVSMEPSVSALDYALISALERHEAFRQEVSNSVVSYFGPGINSDDAARDYFSRFIIAPPVDPKAEAIKEAMQMAYLGDAHLVANYEAALAKHGLAIRKEA